MKRFPAVLQWLPVLVGVGVSVATLFLWQALVAQERAQIQQTVELAAASVKNEIDEGMNSRISALDRMAKRWEYAGKPAQDQWEFEAGLNIKNFEAYQAIQWVDPTYRVRWIVPLEGNELSKNLSLAFEPPRWDALVAARDGRNVTVTRSIDLVQGRKGFEIYVPIFEGEEFSGFITGVFRTQELLDTILKDWKAEENILPGYSIAVFDGEEEIYSHNPDSLTAGARQYQKKWGQEIKIDLRSITWRVEVWPSPELLTRERSPLPETALIGGLSTAFLLALAVYLAQRAGRWARKTETTNQELDHEIKERQQVEQALQESHCKLESRVENRTADLGAANSHLQMEVTERKRVLEALQESEERLKAILDNSTALVYLKDTQGRYLLINHRFETLFHLNSEQIKGKTDYDLFPKEMAEVYRVNDQKVLEAGTALEWEEAVPQDDGLHTYLSIKFPLYDGAGVPYAVCGISSDITERKRAEEALQSSVATNRALLNAMPDLMVRLSNNGTFINYKLPKDMSLPVPASDLLGKTLHEVLPVEVAQPALDCLKQALQTGKVQLFEFQLVAGTNLQNYEARVVVSAENEVMAIVRDITDRKQVEADTRNALEKEKELSELKSRFVSMTSHEFRTPLTTILSSAELLEVYSHKWGEEKKLTHFQRIQVAVKQMTRLLDDVLLIGKAEAGKLEFKPTPLDLGQFCRDLVEEMQISTSSHSIAFCSQGQCQNPVMDEKLLRHILSNLLSNAIKYSPQGSTVHFDLICNLAEATFQVRDEGIGIPEADQVQLFNSFHRASNVGSISGTGLGLAIVKKSLDLHGGNIAVKTQVSVGTTFTVTLPLNKQV